MLAGCGGDGGGDGPTLEEWAAQADEICAQAQEDVEDVEPPGTLGEVPDYVDETAPVVEQELEDLRALERPSEHEARIEEFLARVEETLVAARGTGAAAARGDEESARAAGEQAQAATREARAIAGELGAEECAAQ